MHWVNESTGLNGVANSQVAINNQKYLDLTGTFSVTVDVDTGNGTAIINLPLV